MTEIDLNAPQYLDLVDGGDWSAAIQQAHDDAVPLKLPVNYGGGVYEINAAGILTQDLRFISHGATIRDTRGGGATDAEATRVFQVGGTSNLGQYVNLAEDAPIGTNKLVFDGPHGLGPGDLFHITSNAAFTARSTVYKQGENAVVSRVSGPVVYTTTIRMDTYLASNVARAAKVTPSFVHGVGRLIISAPPSQPDFYTKGIMVAYAMRPTADFGFRGISSDALSVYSSWAPIFSVGSDNNAVQEPGATNTGEGQSLMILGATMFGRFTGDGEYTRHAVATGTSSSFMGVGWENRVSNFVAGGGGNAACFDAHCETGSIYFEGCTAVGGLISDPQVADARPDGFRVAARRNYIKNCHAIRCGQAVTPRDNDVVIDEFFVQMEAHECTSHGFNHNQANVRIKHLKLDLEITGPRDPATLFSAIAISSQTASIDKWEFRNIHANNRRLFYANTGSTIPDRLEIHGGGTRFDIPESDSSGKNGVLIQNPRLKVVQLYNVTLDGAARSVYVTSAVSLDLLELDGCNSRNATRHINIEGTILNLVIRGGDYGNTLAAGGSLVKSTGSITYADIAPSRTSGANLNIGLDGGAYVRVRLGGNMSAISTLFSNTSPIYPLEVLAGPMDRPRVTRGSGVPTHTADSGSLHERADGSGNNTYLYVRRGGSWAGCA